MFDYNNQKRFPIFCSLKFKLIIFNISNLIQRAYIFNPGTVGVPTPWTGIKLVDVPEMNYYAKDDKGEICFRGGNLMNGYFQMPEKTAETIGEIYIFR